MHLFSGSDDGSTSYAARLSYGTTTALDQPDGTATWIYYTLIGATVLIVLIILVLLYDLCSRCCQRREHPQILDGGPPVTPNHHYSYTITVCPGEASSAFDTKNSTLKLDMLNNQNHYLTNLAIPCSILDFKTSGASHRSVDSATPPSASFTTEANLEGWTGFSKTNSLIFHLIKRNPLEDFAFVRLTHDCFRQNAYITFKQIFVNNDQTNQMAQVMAQNKPIRALHACPPSGFQVFSVHPAHSDRDNP